MDAQAPTRDELIANLAYAVKLLGAFPIINATAQVQHLRSVVERASPTSEITRLSTKE